MKQKLLIIGLMLSLTFCSCGQTDITSESLEHSLEMSSSSESSSASESSEVETDEESNDTLEEPVSNSFSEEELEIGGTNAECKEHCFTYHAISGTLVDSIGQDIVMEWYNSLMIPDEYDRLGEGFTILSFIEEYDIPKETFRNLVHSVITDSLLEALEVNYDDYLVQFGYSDAQIDALYSGDQAKINEAFCGEMAWYNPDDGNLYSIYWMSNHSADNYKEVGFPKEEIERIYNAAMDSNTYAYVKLAESANKAVEEYLTE